MHITVEVPDETLSSLWKDPKSFGEELRLAAAVK